MPSLKHCSGVWFAVAGTGSEETAIDNPASAGGGWNLLWFVTEKLLHVLEESVAMLQAAGRGQTRTFAPHPDQMTCLVHPLQLCSWYFSVWKVHSQNLHSLSHLILFSSLNWVTGCAKAGPGATGMLCHRQPSASRYPRKTFQCCYHVLSFCHIKDSLTSEIHFL